LCALVLGVAVWLLRPRPLWFYEGEFHETIRSADRIVVRIPEPEVAKSGKKDGVLFEVTDPSEVKEVYDRLAFGKPQYHKTRCGCHGYPWIDWYEGERCLALAALKHGRDIGWEGFPGQATLTGDSRKWLVDWLQLHGVPQDRLQ